MKKTWIFLPIVIIGLLMLFINAAGGVAKIQNKDRTGSPVSSPNCTACHSGGNFNTSASVSVSDANGSVAQYEPGKTYNVKVHIQSSSTSGNGFQLTALLADNSAAGVGTAVSSGTQVTALGGRQYFEQSTVVFDSVYTMEWTAPSAGSGDVTFYGSALAVNGLSSTSGDEYANIPNLLLTESSSLSVTNIAERAEILIYPNPSQDWIRVNGLEATTFSVQIFDVSGKLVFNQANYMRNQNLYISNLTPGNYVVRAQNNKTVKTAILVKE